MIRFLKQRLSIAERANGDGRWVVHLPDVLRDYNNQPIPGSGGTRRKDVTQDNYLRLLGRLRGMGDVTVLFNMAETLRAPSALSRLFCRYKKGSRVLLSRRANYALRDRHDFEKPSVVGTFSGPVYTVKACLSKLNADLFICPVYQLEELTGLYYPEELSPALFAEGQNAPPPVKRRSRRSSESPRRRRSPRHVRRSSRQEGAGAGALTR